jgi:hypothetical protein
MQDASLRVLSDLDLRMEPVLSTGDVGAPLVDCNSRVAVPAGAAKREVRKITPYKMKSFLPLEVFQTQMFWVVERTTWSSSMMEKSFPL